MNGHRSEDTGVEAVGRIYRELLHREVDEPGARHWARAIGEGMSPVDIAIAIAQSEEYTNRIAADQFFLPNLCELRPDSYQVTQVTGSDEAMTVFRALDTDDFDWLERAILDFGYYNKPGIWTSEINLDKKVMAEIIAVFSPRHPLELGCSTGAVLSCLLDLGVQGEGLEISARAKRNAYPDVRDAIHLGDLLTAELPAPFDLVFGLDVFEHLNPNRLAEYLHALRGILEPSGWLFCNVPAFGPDAVFGEVFPLYLPGWVEDAAAGRPFSELHVDGDGYPMHGHLIWASTDWWVGQFEGAGFHRQTAVEKAIHDRYDRFLEANAPSRKSFYVFSPDLAPDCDAVIRRITAHPSVVLAGTS